MEISLKSTVPPNVAPTQAPAAPRVAEENAPPASAEAEPSASVTISAAARAAAQAERPDPTAAPDRSVVAAPREPDAPTAESNPAVQRYLESASLPDNQPPPSPFRTSA